MARTDAVFGDFSTAKLKYALLAGAGVSTNIAVTGITTSDHIIFAGHFSTAADIATFADITSTTAITSAGNIQSTTDTANDQVFLFWVDVDA